MTGLNLETFLHLLRADIGAWATLGLIVVVLALMAWTSWGSRRALRKCLILSIIAHCGLVLYGGTVPVILLAVHPDDPFESSRERIRQIKVAPVVDDTGRASAAGDLDPSSPTPGARGGIAAWDRSLGQLALNDAKLTADRTPSTTEVAVRPGEREALPADSAAPEGNAPEPPRPEARPDEPTPAADEPAPGQVAPGGEEIAPAVVAALTEPVGDRPLNHDPQRMRPERAAPNPIAPAPRSPQAAAPPLATPVAALPAPLAERPAAGTTTVPSSDPAPAALVEAGDRDVAAPEVVAARPNSARLTPGTSNLRSRSRPGTGQGVAGGLTPSRSPLTLDTPRATLTDAPGPAPATGVAVADRPVREAPAVALAAPTAVPAEVAAPELVRPEIAPLPRLSAPETDVRRRARPDLAANRPATPREPRPLPNNALALSRVTPSGVPALPEIQGAMGGRPIGDVPEVYRSRLDPNRSARAFSIGASPASEQAVERALDWLARHQDTDGRWDGATAKDNDGNPIKGDDDFTVHCPAGETCFGECVYWEADTALTGLALLSYLGAGYTQTDGKYADTVGKGLDYLLLIQKPDGDLRGRSRVVGMYCHAMATIALCEAYALTGEERLREPVERAIGYIIRARARDGLAWRYSPGESIGDTSILGWVVMALKSAREVGIAIPSQVQNGVVTWLGNVATGEAMGLARYQPRDKVTPTMTAEAWVCRQFLGVGGPGAASSEAAEFLLKNPSDRGTHNFYYLYYGTLAMYQHGGEPWFRWNARVRDELIKLQRVRGHMVGSWDPDDSLYGSRGGRVYCTALATLSLEVYYRYLRLYDDPKIPPAVAPNRRPGDRTLGRAPGQPASRTNAAR